MKTIQVTVSEETGKILEKLKKKMCFKNNNAVLEFSIKVTFDLCKDNWANKNGVDIHGKQTTRKIATNRNKGGE